MPNPHDRFLIDDCIGEVPSQRYLDYQDGIREVAEWINNGNIIHDINWSGGGKEWQTKLKEWGVK